jgi:hypothetical protein
MNRPAHELALHLDAIARDLEQVERVAFQRRMVPALELELVTMRREIGAMKGMAK